LKSHVFETQSLTRQALNYGITITEQHVQSFNIYLEELWTWNQRKNLIGLSVPQKIITELLLDSLIPAPFLPTQGKLLDVGSGARFPALPLKIYIPNLKVHLLEPNQKKVSFLKQVIRLLKLSGIEVIKNRLEAEEPKLKAEAYDLITTRAFTNLSQTISWSSPLLKPGSRLVCFLGPQGQEDLKKLEPELINQAIKIDKVLAYLLPGKAQKRHTVIFIKTINQ
jgi:16S rRNA (guanine527-N7)-methyltransferase